MKTQISTKGARGGSFIRALPVEGGDASPSIAEKGPEGQPVKVQF